MGIQFLRHGLALAALAALAALLMAGCCHMAAGPGVMVDFPTKQAEVSCSSTCKVVVHARIAPHEVCEVMAEVETIRVPALQRPKIIWIIKKLDPSTDHYDYKFDFQPTSVPPVYGVDIKGNNPLKDFQNPGYEHASGHVETDKFKWDDKHDQVLTFTYDLNVLRSPHNQEDWKPCKSVDPKIAND